MIVVFLCVTVPVPHAAAQEAVGRGPVTVPTDIEQAIALIAPSSVLRLRWDRERLTEGRILLPGVEDMLRVRGEARAIDIPYAQIDSIWVRRSHAARGAALGGLSGTALGALVLLGISDAVCTSASGSCSGPSATGWLLLVGGGAAAGAVVGSIIGSTSRNWTLEFPTADP